MAGTSTPKRVEPVRVGPRSEAEAREDFERQVVEAAAELARHPLRTERHYNDALRLIRQLLLQPHGAGTPGGNALEILSILVERYEDENVPDLGEASPREVVQFMAEQKGISPGELAETLGGRSRLSDFMNEKRELSKEQIKRLRQLLGVPADLLISLAVVIVSVFKAQ